MTMSHNLGERHTSQPHSGVGRERRSSTDREGEKQPARTGKTRAYLHKLQNVAKAGRRRRWRRPHHYAQGTGAEAARVLASRPGMQAAI